MKISLEQSNTTFDIDPDDLTDDSLKECIGIARKRGLLDGEPRGLESQLRDLHIAINFAYTSLLVAQPQIAIARLALYVTDEYATSEMRKAYAYLAPKVRQDREFAPPVNGYQGAQQG